jgi:DNA-binding transcriptional LysR family regulator
MATKLTYRHIEVIRAVMLTGSVTGAAASLHVTQPAISHLLREIDGLLAFSLFDRQAGRLVPTGRARLIFDEIERSFIGLDIINDVCARLRVSEQRSVTIALVPVAAAAIMPAVIAEYRRTIGSDFFLIDSAGNEQVVGQIVARKADFGIALETTAVPGIQSHLLFEFEARCLLAHDHPLAGRAVIHAGDLMGMDMIHVPRADRLADPIIELLGHGVAAPIQVVECAGATGACAMVEAGIGFAILDPVAAFPFRNSGIWFARFEPRVTFRFCAYWLEGREARFDREALARLVTERCRELDRLCLSIAPGDVATLAAAVPPIGAASAKSPRPRPAVAVSPGYRR